MQSVTSHGATIPLIGLGTWQLNGDTCVKIVSDALKSGYRHVDTAAMYGNETEVGEGMRASGIRREDVFLTTKVWRDNLRAKDFRASVEASLAKLKFDYADLILIHWPNDEYSARRHAGCDGGGQARGPRASISASRTSRRS